MPAAHRKNVLTIPPGAPFLKTLASALCEGRLTERYRHDPSDPLSLAKVTIFVPTRRAARVLRSEFVDLLGGRSAILPLIRPLGETDDDSGFFELDAPAAMDLAPPIGNTARLLELGQLILAWRNRLPQVVLDIHSESPLVAPASPADAIWLARGLAELIDAIETEERDWKDLEKLDTGDYPLWWQLTAEFLKIASVFWPNRLGELKRSSPARHSNTLLKAEAARLPLLPDHGPVIVAGSTGSIPAAAELIAAVAAMPNGSVVLPGLDLAMPDDQWQMIGDDASISGDPTSRAHPQYGLHRLLQKLELSRDDMRIIGEISPELALRAAAISQALAPAKATDRWNEWRNNVSADSLEKAFRDVALIEAANEREEATAIAIAIRLALEKPGARGDSQAALITPDRTLARRVAAELARFGIVADDSAGTTLSTTPQATLLQLALEATLRPGDPVAIVSLLKHPLARFGMSDEERHLAVDAFELLALRGGVGDSDITALEPLLERQFALHRQDRHPPNWRTALPGNAPELARHLARRIAKAVEPLAAVLVRRQDARRGLTAKLSLSDWAERSGRTIEAIAMDAKGDLATLWSGEAGEKLASLLAEIMETDGQMQADGPQWIDIMAALTAGAAVKPGAMSHPRVFIFGALEARLQSMDTLVLGGLNEGVWPGQTANNPFLSRTMKTAIGLEPPERRIGQLAHDFEMACGTQNLIYSRALRQGSTPAVASRWLQRLLALGGTDLEKNLKKRGDEYLQWTALLDAGGAQTPARRPAPTPPADLQPRSYSFSEVGRLRRDPYAIYARRILKLDPVTDFNRDPGVAERGTLYHAIIERYIREGHVPGTPASEEAMRRILDELFDAATLPAHIDMIWRPRFRKVARAFLDWEQARYPDIKQSFTEVPAGMELAAAGIRLTGIADRIDIKRSGLADIIDYKTGLSPSLRQARSLLDPQLALEAAALRDGAFRNAGTLVPENLLYVRLRPGERFGAEQVNNEHAKASARTEPKSALDLAGESIDQLTRFVTLLRSGDKGFVSRLIPAQQNDHGGEYDHLARVSEWATAEAEEVESDE